MTSQPPHNASRPSLAARLGALVRPVLQRRRQCSVAGHVDEARDGVLHGWAWRKDKPGRRLSVDVFINGRFVGQARAHLLRQDLRDAGIGDGCYGFELLIGDRLPLDLAGVRAFALDERRIELMSPASQQESRPIAGIDDYLRATFSGQIAQAGHEPFPAAPLNLKQSGRWTKLLAASDIDRLSAYVRHIARREAFGLDGDRAATLVGYLRDHGRRRGRMRAPLSASEIAWLNEGPTSETPFAPGRAQRLLSRVRATEDAEAAFAWALYESAAFAVEDCLVPKAHVDALAACDQLQGGALPLFVQRFLAGMPFLTGADRSDPASCDKAWLTVLLHATATPHVLNYLPVATVARFITPDEESGNAFDTMMTQVFGASSYTAARWRADIARAGYDLDRRAFAHLMPDGHRIWSAAQPIHSAPIVDVQLIGPFSRRLGISDSCRTLAASLQLTSRSLRLCDYTLDHPNAARDCDGFALEQPGPARITILHLNLEDAPTALAYLPDVFSDTHLVVVPYLELSKPEPSQDLGLAIADEVWAPSRFIADALSGHSQVHAIGTACKPLRSVDRAAARARLYGVPFDESDFICLTAGDALSGMRRKNALGAIAAFRAAFPEDRHARLVVKTHSPALVSARAERAAWEAIQAAAQADSRILLMDAIVSDDDMAALLEGADCLISLHRAEGFGYHLIEAMQLATPVVATNWSGNTDFCTPETAFLVDFALQPIESGAYFNASAGQVWAEPDHAAAVAALRMMRENPDLRANKAEAAKALVAREFSVGALAARVERRLAEILGAPVSFRD